MRSGRVGRAGVAWLVVAAATIVGGAGVWSSPASAASGAYRALTPQRLLDTRQGLGAPGPVGADATITLDVTGVGGVPESGVAAVALNVTAVGATASTYVTVWPTGQPKPVTSNLNVRPGVDTPNMVIATVGADGTVSLANQFGSVNLIADVTGWFAAGADYHALTPARVLDTRQGVGAPGPVGAGATIELDVTGAGGVPDAGVTAVVLNVTAVEATTGTYVTVWPTGQPKPNTSNLNVQPGVDTPNLVIATVGASGTVSLANQFGSVNLIADVAGWFSVGAGYQALTPQRLLDTRQDVGAAGPVPAGGTITLDVTGTGGVPAGGVAAVVLNVTAVAATTGTYVTVWPTGQPKPNTSNLNVQPAADTPNLVIATVGADGTVSLANQFGSVHLIADVSGWFPGTPAPNPGDPGTIYYPGVGPLNAFDPATASERIVYDGSDQEADGYAWQGYGVSWTSGEFAYQALRPANAVQGVRIRDLATGALTGELDVGCAGCTEFRAELSPNGQLIAIDGANTDHPLHIYNRQGQLLNEFRAVSDATWAPDGTLIFVGEPINDRYMMGRFVDVATSDQFEKIAEYNPAAVPFDDLPAWTTVSPTNAEVAYEYLGDIWVQTADGSAATKVADAPSNHARGPAFSPDGQQIGFHLDTFGPVHVVPAHPPAPTAIAYEGPTALRDNRGHVLIADGQLHWLA